MQAILCKGKHAELCRLIADGRRDDAMRYIYAFFRSEDNTDSYSVSLLTMIRELMEDGDSDELYRMRIRMRSSGDRVLINMAQFVWALETGGMEDAAETLAGKCLSDMPKLARSMQEFADEEGISPASEMAGMRIREAVRILRMYFDSVDMADAVDKLDDVNLDMTRIFLFTKGHMMSEDLMKAAKCAARHGDMTRRNKLCREIVREYGYIVDTLLNAADFVRESYEMLDGVKYAYETLNDVEPDTPYTERISAIHGILNENKA